MAGTDERFARRWSRLKREERRRKDRPAAEPPVESGSKDTASPEAADAKATPADLPDIESLDKDSDFSVFLKDGVPEELRRLALRKLWRADPVFAVIDGLDDYDEDYRTAMVVAEHLAKRLAKAGKGKADKGAVTKERETVDKGAETKEPETRDKRDERPAQDRAAAPAQTRHEDQDKASSGGADKKDERAPEPKPKDDAETG